MPNHHYSRQAKSKILKELEQSGLSLLEFSRRTGIAPSTLQTWRKKAELELKPDKIAVSKQEATFLELTSSSYYEIRLGAVVIKVPTSEPSSKLVELARALAC